MANKKKPLKYRSQNWFDNPDNADCLIGSEPGTAPTMPEGEATDTTSTEDTGSTESTTTEATTSPG